MVWSSWSGICTYPSPAALLKPCQGRRLKHIEIQTKGCPEEPYCMLSLFPKGNSPVWEVTAARGKQRQKLREKPCAGRESGCKRWTFLRGEKRHLHKDPGVVGKTLHGRTTLHRRTSQLQGRHSHHADHDHPHCILHIPPQTCFQYKSCHWS